MEGEVRLTQLPEFGLCGCGVFKGPRPECWCIKLVGSEEWLYYEKPTREDGSAIMVGFERYLWTADLDRATRFDSREDADKLIDWMVSRGFNSSASIISVKK